MIMVPDVSELEQRLRRHLGERPGDDGVVTAWRSYLAALVEWGCSTPARTGGWSACCRRGSACGRPTRS